MTAQEARQKTLDNINGFENQATEWDSIMKAIEETTKGYNYFSATWRTSKRMNLENWIKLHELGYFVYGGKDSTNQFIEYQISFDRVYPKMERGEIIRCYHADFANKEITLDNE